MTKITRENVLHLAKLSSLHLTETEIEAMQTDLTKIVEYIEVLDELDTSGVAPQYQVTGLENVMRADATTEQVVGREDLLAMSAETADQQVKVPKVL